MWVRIEKRREQKGARGRRKGSLTMDAFPKEGKRGPPPNTKLPTVHTFPSTPPTSRRLACRICWTVRPEGMGAARLQDCETRRDYYCSMSALDMFGWSVVWRLPSNDFCTSIASAGGISIASHQRKGGGKAHR